MNLFILCLPEQNASFLRAGTLSVLFSYATGLEQCICGVNEWVNEWYAKYFCAPGSLSLKVTVDRNPKQEIR